MDCNNCLGGMSSSKCVEFDSNYSVYEKLAELINKNKISEDKFTKSVDGKTLGTGQDLVATVQKLVDIEIAPNETHSLAPNKVYDVSSISDVNTLLNQDDLNLLLIKTIFNLQQDVQKLITYNNLYNV